MSTQPPLPPLPEPDKDAIINRLLNETSRDFLTAAYNARHFRELLNLEVARARRYKVPFSLLMGDIGNFKQLKDTFGPVSGDKALKAVAKVINAFVRVTDFDCRIGEADFAIILTHTELTGASCGERLTNRIAALQLPEELRDVALSVTFALAQYRPPESPDSFIRRMDDDDPDEGLLGVPVPRV